MLEITPFTSKHLASQLNLNQKILLLTFSMKFQLFDINFILKNIIISLLDHLEERIFAGTWGYLAVTWWAIIEKKKKMTFTLCLPIAPKMVFLYSKNINATNKSFIYHTI